jgi:hypothetical protein
MKNPFLLLLDPNSEPDGSLGPPQQRPSQSAVPRLFPVAASLVDDKSTPSRFSLAFLPFSHNLVVTHGGHCPQTRLLSYLLAYHTEAPLRQH